MPGCSAITLITGSRLGAQSLFAMLSAVALAMVCRFACNGAYSFSHGAFLHLSRLCFVKVIKCAF